MDLELHDLVTTEKRSRLTIVMTDNTTLSSVKPIIMEFDRTPTRFLIRLFSGSLEASVIPPNNIEFLTPNGELQIRGTLFDIKYIEGNPCPGFPNCLRYTDIGVYKGIVEVRNPTSLKPVSVRVTAGYETTIPCELPPAQPGPLGMSNITAPGYH